MKNKRIGQQYRTSAQLIAAITPDPVVKRLNPLVDEFIRRGVAKRAAADNARLLRNLERMGFTL